MDITHVCKIHSCDNPNNPLITLYTGIYHAYAVNNDPNGLLTQITLDNLNNPNKKVTFFDILNPKFNHRSSIYSPTPHYLNNPNDPNSPYSPNNEDKEKILIALLTFADAGNPDNPDNPCH